jgi:hypothetical protein
MICIFKNSLFLMAILWTFDGASAADGTPLSDETIKMNISVTEVTLRQSDILSAEFGGNEYSLTSDASLGIFVDAFAAHSGTIQKLILYYKNDLEESRALVVNDLKTMNMYVEKKHPTGIAPLSYLSVEGLSIYGLATSLLYRADITTSLVGYWQTLNMESPAGYTGLMILKQPDRTIPRILRRASMDLEKRVRTLAEGKDKF